MQLISYMHDFFCNGSKKYKHALSNVQDYNLTKILTNKCAIPSVDGIFKHNIFHFNVFWAIQMDVERFNYFDVLLRKSRLGTLETEIAL